MLMEQYIYKDFDNNAYNEFRLLQRSCQYLQKAFVGFLRTKYKCVQVKDNGNYTLKIEAKPSMNEPASCEYIFNLDGEILPDKENEMTYQMLTEFVNKLNSCSSK